MQMVKRVKRHKWPIEKQTEQIEKSSLISMQRVEKNLSL